MKVCRLLVILIISALLCGCGNAEGSLNGEKQKQGGLGKLFGEAGETQSAGSLNLGSLHIEDFVAGNSDAESSNAESSSDNLPNENSDEIATKLLYVTINPQFEVYLNKSWNIVGVAATNEDAEELLDGMDVSGMPYEAGMDILLNVAVEKGFLHKESTVQLVYCDWSGEDSSEELPAIIEEQMDGFFKEKNLDIELVSTVYTLEDLQAGVEAGNRPDAAGYTYYDNGNLRSSRVEMDDGSIKECTFYEDESLKSSRIVTVDGSVLEYTYYKNGNEKSGRREWKDGTLEEYTCYENGSYENSYYRGADGTVQECSYYENGAVKTSCMKGTDGSVAETTYYEDGRVVKSHYVAADGMVSDYSVDESGKTYSGTIMPNGDVYKMESVYYANGQEKWRYEYRLEGGVESTSEMTFDEQGNVTSYVSGNGTSNKDVGEGTQYAGGSENKNEYTYYANGQMHTITMFDSNGEVSHKEEYYENGSIAYVYDMNTNGSMYEHYYYTNGQISFLHAEDPNAVSSNYVYQESTYSENGWKLTGKYVDKHGLESYQEYTYYSSGQVKTEHTTNSNGEVSDASYYENGQVAAYTTVYPDGTSYTGTFAEDGTPTYSTPAVPN